MLCETTAIQPKIWLVLRAVAVPLTLSFQHGADTHKMNVMQVSWRCIASEIDIYRFVVRSFEYESGQSVILQVAVIHYTCQRPSKITLSSHVTLRHISLRDEIPCCE
jgi:hypothetical protein